MYKLYIELHRVLETTYLVPACSVPEQFSRSLIDTDKLALTDHNNINYHPCETRNGI